MGHLPGLLATGRFPSAKTRPLAFAGSPASISARSHTPVSAEVLPLSPPEVTALSLLKATSCLQLPNGLTGCFLSRGARPCHGNYVARPSAALVTVPPVSAFSVTSVSAEPSFARGRCSWRDSGQVSLFCGAERAPSVWMPGLFLRDLLGPGPSGPMEDCLKNLWVFKLIIFMSLRNKTLYFHLRNASLTGQPFLSGNPTLFLRIHTPYSIPFFICHPAPFITSYLTRVVTALLCPRV